MIGEHMVEELVQFYGAAGLSDYYERELNGEGYVEIESVPSGATRAD